MHRSCNFEALNTSQEMVVVSHGNDIASAAHRSDLHISCFSANLCVIVCDSKHAQQCKGLLHVNIKGL